MRYCSNCGNSIEESQKYCPNCGVPISGETRSMPNTGKTEKPGQNKGSRFWIGFFIGIVVVIGLYYAFHENTERNYRLAISNYENRYYQEALYIFDGIDYGYEARDIYEILCQGHLNEYLSPAQVETLKANLDFQDAKELLLSCDSIGADFLNGYWSSEDKYSLECYNEGDKVFFQWNIPSPQYDKEKALSWYIQNGMFGVIIDNDSDPTKDHVELFRISIINADSIAISSVKGDRRIVLKREK